MEWDHYSANARVLINGTIQNVGHSTFPFTSFNGTCAIGGVFYEGSHYPAEYQSAYFFSDFNNNWVKALKIDNANNPTHKIDFAPSVGGVVKWAYNPMNESLYYVSVNGNIVKLNYEANQNQSPKAAFSANKYFGQNPVNVAFDATESNDFENETLTYQWNFGDNTTGTGKNVNHTFTAPNSSPISYLVSLTVTDTHGNTGTFQREISVNNTPPKIISTSVDALSKFLPDNSMEINLNANVIDNEESAQNLTYKWEVFFYHNEHKHTEYSAIQAIGNYILEPVACDNNSYFYQIQLTVTDSYGLSTKFTKNLYQNCLNSDINLPNIPQIAVENFKVNGFTIRWSNPTDDLGVKSAYLHLNDEIIRIQPAALKYDYVANYSILGQNFVAQIFIVDRAGNISKTSKLYFSRPSELCSPLTYLSDLTPVSSTNGNGPIEIDKSTNTLAGNDGNPIKLNGVLFTKGIGVHANSTIVYDLSNYNNSIFSAKVGLDDEVGSSCGSIIFRVFKDDILAYTSPVMIHNSATQNINLDISNTQLLKLDVSYATDGVGCDHADWADAKLLPSCPDEDFQAPTSVQNLNSTMENGLLNIVWNSANDNLPNPIAYEIFLDNTLIISQPGTSYNFMSFPNGNHEITIQAKDIYGNLSSANSFLFKCNETLIDASLASIYNCDESCTDMKTVKSGNWADPNIWYCNKTPITTDVVKISEANIVTLSNNVIIKGIIFENNSEVKIENNFTIELK